MALLTPAELKAARHQLGLSAKRFAELIQIGDGRTVRRWEAGDSAIPGPVNVIVGLLLTLPAARRAVGLKVNAAKS